MPVQVLTIVLSVDVDECTVNNGGCAQTCTNNDGSFQCSCYDGYLVASNEILLKV